MNPVMQIPGDGAAFRPTSILAGIMHVCGCKSSVRESWAHLGAGPEHMHSGGSSQMFLSLASRTQKAAEGLRVLLVGILGLGWGGCQRVEGAGRVCLCGWHLPAFVPGMQTP